MKRINHFIRCQLENIIDVGCLLAAAILDIIEYGWVYRIAILLSISCLLGMFV